MCTWNKKAALGHTIPAARLLAVSSSELAPQVKFPSQIVWRAAAEARVELPGAQRRAGRGSPGMEPRQLLSRRRRRRREPLKPRHHFFTCSAWHARSCRRSGRDQYAGANAQPHPRADRPHHWQHLRGGGCAAGPRAEQPWCSRRSVSALQTDIQSRRILHGSGLRSPSRVACPVLPRLLARSSWTFDFYVYKINMVSKFGKPGPLPAATRGAAGRGGARARHGAGAAGGLPPRRRRRWRRQRGHRPRGLPD